MQYMILKYSKKYIYIYPCARLHIIWCKPWGEIAKFNTGWDTISIWSFLKSSNNHWTQSFLFKILLSLMYLNMESTGCWFTFIPYICSMVKPLFTKIKNSLWTQYHARLSRIKQLTRQFLFTLLYLNKSNLVPVLMTGIHPFCYLTSQNSHTLQFYTISVTCHQVQHSLSRCSSFSKIAFQKFIKLVWVCKNVNFTPQSIMSSSCIKHIEVKL